MKKYVDYLRKTRSLLCKLAEEEHLSKIYVFWDYTKALLKHRCLIRQYVNGQFWKKSEAERSKCMTYNRMIGLFDKYNQSECVNILNRKEKFNGYFSDMICRKWLYLQNSTFEEFRAFVAEHYAIIVKPIDQMCGKGIRKLVFSEIKELNLRSIYEELRKEDVVVEEIIKQHPNMVFGNASVNTIRVYTTIDDRGCAHVIKAILRAGVGEAIVDNFCAGGYIYEVNIEAGIVCTFGVSHENNIHYVHPLTNIIMLGYKIPNWEKVIDVSLKAAEKIPQVRIVGWDVAITSKSVELIEGNSNPDYELLEFIGSNGYYEKIRNLLKCT